MTLAKLQSELAALLMEPGRLERFEKNPRAHAERAGLRGTEAELLAGLPVEGARYFAQRRLIDRFGYLRADLPHSIPRMERAALDRYFAAFPYAFEDPMKEVARFAKWADLAAGRGEIPILTRDIIAVESTAILLLHRAHRPAAPSRRPKRAPGVTLVSVSHDPEHFLHDHPWMPEPGAFTVVLQRTADDVENPVLKPAELAALRAATGRKTETQLLGGLLRAGVSKTKAATALRRLRSLGLLCRA